MTAPATSSPPRQAYSVRERSLHSYPISLRSWRAGLFLCSLQTARATRCPPDRFPPTPLRPFCKKKNCSKANLWGASPVRGSPRLRHFLLLHLLDRVLAFLIRCYARHRLL